MNTETLSVQDDVDENLVLDSVFVPSFTTKSGEYILKYNKQEEINQPDQIIDTETESFKSKQQQDQDKIKEVQMCNSNYQNNKFSFYKKNLSLSTENFKYESHQKKQENGIQNLDDQTITQQSNQRNSQYDQRRKFQLYGQRLCLTSKNRKYSSIFDGQIQNDENLYLKEKIRLIKANELDLISQRSQVAQSLEKFFKKPHFKFQIEEEKSNIENVQMNKRSKLNIDLMKKFENTEKANKKDVDENLVLDSVFVPSFTTKSGEYILKYNKQEISQPDQIIDTETESFKSKQQQDQDKIKEVQMCNSNYQNNKFSFYKKDLSLSTENFKYESHQKKQENDIQNLDDQTITQESNQRNSQYDQRRKFQLYGQRICLTSKNQKYIPNVFDGQIQNDENLYLKEKIRLIKANELDLIGQRSQVAQSQEKFFKKPHFKFQIESERSNIGNTQMNKRANLNINLMTNHFEEKFEIFLSDKKQIKYAKQFIEKCSNDNTNLSKIDQRIYSSIILNSPSNTQEN
ncbi:hypothetical protein ABPG74_000658 [Tetrahymena malaccensis]